VRERGHDENVLFERSLVRVVIEGVEERRASGLILVAIVVVVKLMDLDMDDWSWRLKSTWRFGEVEIVVIACNLGSD
jgi:hypothetical protein